MNRIRLISLTLEGALLLVATVSCAALRGMPAPTPAKDPGASRSPQAPVWEHILDDQDIYVTHIAFDDLNNAWITTTYGDVIYFNTAEREIVDSWKIGEGLNPFSSLSIDPRGNVWIDVFPQPGILHFDGKQWTTLLPDHDVTAVIFDSEDRAWIGTDGDGIFMEYPEQWMTYRIDGLGCSNNEIDALAVDPQGRVWVATDDGVAVLWEGSVIACHPLDSQIWEFVFDNEGGVYVSTVLDGLYYLDRGKWDRLVSDTWITPGSLAVDASGLVWVSGKELKVFDGRELVMNVADIAGGIDISPSGVVWVHGWELHRYDGSAWTTFNVENSEISFSEGMGPLEFDHHGNVWLAGTEPGIDVIHLEEAPPVQD